MKKKKEHPLFESPPFISSGEYLVASYHPSSLFSLRLSPSSSTGGKTLFVPTPYSVKLALVDVGYRILGGPLSAERLFNIVKNRTIRFLPPEFLVVTHTFQRMLREDGDTFKRTINYREYCFFRGVLEIAINIQGLSETDIDFLCNGLRCINYFGKRGSFFQFLSFRRANESELDDLLFTKIKEEGTPSPEILDRYGIAQPLDDFANPSDPLLFDKINYYTKKPDLDASDRPYSLVWIPYHLIRSSFRFSYYRRGKASEILYETR